MIKAAFRNTAYKSYVTDPREAYNNITSTVPVLKYVETKPTAPKKKIEIFPINLNA
jgi:hypothetical protein